MLEFKDDVSERHLSAHVRAREQVPLDGTPVEADRNGITHRAWMIPGRYPSKVRRQLIQKSAFNPRSKKTPTGGMKIAKKILQISLI